MGEAVSPKSFRLPDTVANWPWPRKINPHYEEVKAESEAWFRSFKAFSPASQKAFDLCDFSLLASLSYLTLSKEQLRTSCDMMNLFFVFDEYTDDAEPHLVRKYADIVMDAIRNPFKERPEGEVLLGAVAQQFWAPGIKTASVTAARRFEDSFGLYTDSVVRQAEFRNRHYIPTVKEYLEVRRQTIGVYPTYAMIELPYDLPDDVFNHPVFVDLTNYSRDMIILDNDLCSYNKEQASEEIPHNMVTVVMYHFECDLHEALEKVAEMHKGYSDAFLARWRDIPQWDPSVEAIARDYLEGMANWVRSNVCWNFESGRYFAKKGKEIQKSREVTLMPRKFGLSYDEQLQVVHNLF